MKRMFIISNRLPVKVKQLKNRIELIPSDGGLATGLNSLTSDLEKHWIGWPGIFPKAKSEKAGIKKLLNKCNIHPVFLSRKDFKYYYEGFSNETLWPLFHYFNQFTSYNERSWEVYKKVNQFFAGFANSLIKPGDIVWVQDYHLMLLPALLRERLHHNKIGYFLHIPFPSYELYRTLPWRKELLEGILGADLIGFHTHEYMRHFTSAVYRILNYESKHDEIYHDFRTAKIDAFPMGINFEKFHDACNKPGVIKHIDEITQRIGAVKMVLSVDRLDYSKGIIHRLKAFNELLCIHSKYREKVILHMIVVPSRNEVRKYQSLKEEIDEAVGNINGRFSTINWTPVHYIYRSISFEQLNALYNIADICLVTPLRDGMNLVAKEFVASKNNLRGVLILSEMAGSAIELEGAIKINPNNTLDIVKALLAAINMPEKEQEQRLMYMQKRIKSQTVQKWASDFIFSLDKISERDKMTAEFDKTKVIFDHYSESAVALLILDYDGTLVPFSDNPDLAMPDHELMDLIERASRNNTVVIISGRDHHTIEKWFGSLNVELIAEHGTWIKRNGNWQLTREASNEWKEEVKITLQNFVDRTPGSFLEEKVHSLAWHYRKTDNWLAEVRVPQLMNTLSGVCINQNLQVFEGNKIVEVAITGLDKGTAAYPLLVRQNWDFILAMGDDRTDENLFKALPENAFSLKVGRLPTVANYRLQSWREARKFLNELVNTVKKPLAGILRELDNEGFR